MAPEQMSEIALALASTALWLDCAISAGSVTSESPLSQWLREYERELVKDETSAGSPTPARP